MTGADLLSLVRENGVVLESARGPVPNLVEAIVGAPVKGSWWGHAKGKQIFHLLNAVRDSGQVLVCRLVDGKITYVHRDAWPALVRLAPEIPTERIAAIEEIHTASGKHRVVKTPFPKWVPEDVLGAAKKLSLTEAVSLLRGVVPAA
ncbi:MAG TPA: hypothetical protein VEQ87_19380 [Burkholderiales bacterium]|nr:hypothetical protein [Burkholderiales bacterium]